jgi:hypothetical protein
MKTGRITHAVNEAVAAAAKGAVMVTGSLWGWGAAVVPSSTAPEAALQRPPLGRVSKVDLGL